MKKNIVIAGGVFLALLIVVVIVWRRPEGSPQLPSAMPASASERNGVANGEKRQTQNDTVSHSDALALLEKRGCIPEGAVWSEYKLAEKSSWWGKRLDPAAFWSNRVIWLDAKAIGDAWRYGRRWPPMPYDDPSVANRSDEDRRGISFDIQGGPNISFVFSERENAFWDKFGKTHPKPPSDIAHWQENHAEAWLRQNYLLENDPSYAARLRIDPKLLEVLMQTDQRNARALGYPPESASPEAYRWAHILQKRQEYEAIVAGGRSVDEAALASFFRKVYVEKDLITQPLTTSDLIAASAWRLAYLRRLGTENGNESYINAYLKAWNLSAQQVFAPPSH